MSIVKAYRCDYCGRLKEDSEMIGINPTEDLFNRLDSFPVINNNDKTNVHHCMECYREKVVNPASKINRKKNEDDYKLELKSQYYGLKAKCVSNVRTGFFTDKRKKASEQPGYWKNNEGQPVAESE